VARTHRYTARLVWEGSTGPGYAGYDRAHRVATPPAGAELAVSADPTFRGDAALVNPEQLLLAAASSCQLLSFLALAAQARVDVVAYEDDAEAVMPMDATPVRITRLTLRPTVTVTPGTDLNRVRTLIDAAHESCYIANTLTADIVIEPTIEHLGERPDMPQAEPGNGDVRS